MKMLNYKKSKKKDSSVYLNKEVENDNNYNIINLIVFKSGPITCDKFSNSKKKIKKREDENDPIKTKREIFGIKMNPIPENEFFNSEKKKEKTKEDSSVYLKEEDKFNDSLKRFRESIGVPYYSISGYDIVNLEPKKKTRLENFVGSSPNRNDGNTIIPNSRDKYSKECKQYNN